jgi:hypothetical protein
MAKHTNIKNETLRGLMDAAYTAIRKGDFTASVHHSAEAVRQLLVIRPDAFTAGPLAGTRRIFPPFVGTRLVIENVSDPQVIFDREKFTMSEALTWYEYATENIVISEPQS